MSALMEWGAITRYAIVNDARRIYARRYASRIAEHKGCLFWAASFNEAARAVGIDALLQAGSASFQFQHDDGVSPTHFTYEFEAAPAMLRFQNGELPEMHVWSAIKDTNEIVDLSTKFQAQQAKETQGFDWEPRFQMGPWLWVGVEWLRQCNSRYIYRADALATMMSLAFLDNFKQENREEPTR
jgi:hypothetical protein